MHRFLRDVLRDEALAADGTQETFVRAFRGVDETPVGTRLHAWVFGIARNVSLELRRARLRTRRVISDDKGQDPIDAHENPPTVGSPESALLDQEALQVVSRAFDRLPEDRRAVLVLRLDHGMSYEAIAEVMGWSLAKVKVEIFRGREVLRATLSEYRGDAR
ncbi:MAG: hypothetical protein NVS3B20_10650 [Polyangiales bacterium]